MPIINSTRQKELSRTVEVANSPFKRMKGLLGRSSMDPQGALLITGCNSIHMFFMKFPIDVIFIDGKNDVVGLVANIKPFQLSPIFWKSACAVELPAGTIESTGTQVGDRLQIS